MGELFLPSTPDPREPVCGVLGIDETAVEGLRERLPLAVHPGQHAPGLRYEFLKHADALAHGPVRSKAPRNILIRDIIVRRVAEVVKVAREGPVLAFVFVSSHRSPG